MAFTFGVTETTNLLNKMKEKEIKAKSWVHLATTQTSPLFRAVIKGDGIIKEQSSDKVTWGAGVNALDDAVFGQDYRGAARRSAPLPSVKCDYFLPLQEAKQQTYDVRELSAHMNAGYQKFGDYLGEQDDQWREGIMNDQEKKLAFVPANSSDKYSPQGIMWYCQPNRDNSGVIEAAATGGFLGDRMMYADGTTTQTRNGLDLSVQANSKFKNYCHSIDPDINEDTVKAFRKAFRLTSFMRLPFASERFSTGSLKNSEQTSMNMKLATSTRIYCNGADFDALAAYVDAVSPDDTGGDAIKFSNPKFVGLEREWLPVIDPEHAMYLDGEGTIWPYSPMYLINLGKWTMDMKDDLWKPTPWMPNPDNQHFGVARGASAQYNLRPTNDVRTACATFYRLTA